MGGGAEFRKLVQGRVTRGVTGAEAVRSGRLGCGSEMELRAEPKDRVCGVRERGVEEDHKGSSVHSPTRCLQGGVWESELCA